MQGPDSWRCSAASLAPGATAKFRLQCSGGPVEGFVVNHAGAYAAYVNVCAHAGTPLDLRSTGFHSEDGRWLVCATLGAIYDPGTGVCVEGPGPGARLSRLPVTLDGDTLTVSCP
jgi:nitrite reductase/ring-hydroxylating ferredoxin subunit